MNIKVRYALAGIAGVLIAGTIVFSIEAISHMVYPVSESVDLNDIEQVKAMIAGLPVGAFMFVLAAYFVGTYVGSWVACMIARSSPRIFAGIVGALMLAGTAMNLITIPHPLWFSIVALTGIPVMAFLASITMKQAAA